VLLARVSSALEQGGYRRHELGGPVLLAGELASPAARGA
jgi:hypothetical protein